MKEDRLTTLLGVLVILTGLLAISVGRFIMGGLILLLAFGIFWNRGGGKFNDRSLYEKLVRTDLSIEDIYSKLEGMQTPLGRPWLAVHKGFEGDSIVQHASGGLGIYTVNKLANSTRLVASRLVFGH